MLGTLYFLQEGADGCIKIGWTGGSVRDRWMSNQTGNSADLRLLGTIDGATLLDERDWHIRFRGIRRRGEWFWPSAVLIDAINATAKPTDLSPEQREKRIPAQWVMELQRWMEREGHNSVSLAHLLGYRETTLSNALHNSMASAAMAARIAEVTGVAA